MRFRYSVTTDYNAMAAALKTMHLFQGSFTGYGQGYDLEVAPTRMQALIMFIRVLGEEDEALAYTGTCPFTDVAAGSQSAKYVGYAYSKGYTNGYSADTFRPSQTVTASQYVEFILRALGYSSVDNIQSLPDPVQSAGQRRDHRRANWRPCRAAPSSGPIWCMSPITPWMPWWPAAAAPCGRHCWTRAIFTAGEARQAAAMVTSQRK